MLNNPEAQMLAAMRRLEDACRLILPDLRHSIQSGDGRFTPSQLEAVQLAVNEAAGLRRAERVAA